MKSPFVSRLFFSLTAVFLTASLLLTYGCLTRVDRNEIVLPPAFESAETTAAGTAPDPGSSDPSEAQPVSRVPQTASAPVTAPAVTAPLLTVPAVTSPVPESTSAPVTTAPATTSAPITAPVTSAPITTAPVTAPPVTKAPETTAPVTTAEPPAVIPTKPGAAVTYAAADILFTTAHPAASSVSLSSARSIYSLNGWSGNQYFLDGTVSYTWFLSYTEPVWVN